MPPSNSGVTVIIAGQDDLGPVLDKVEERLRAAASSGQRAGEALSSGMGHGVTQVQAASAALRSLEGNVPIRAVERFITLLPGVGTALLAAFPLIGLIDFGLMIGKTIGELSSFVKKNDEAGGAIARAYRDAHTEAQITNDELRITDDRLQNEIAKLEHKPENNLKLALDEDRRSADDLAKSLESAAEKSRKLLEENAVTPFKSPYQYFVKGEASTSDVEGSVNSYRGDIADLGAKAADAQRDVSNAAERGDKAGEAAARKRLADASDALAAKQDSYRQWLDAQIKTRAAAAVSPDVETQLGGKQDANLAILRGERVMVGDEGERQSLQKQVASDTGTVAKLRGDKDAEKDAGKAEEAARKLQEARDKLQAAEVSLANANSKREEAAGKSLAEFQLAANEAAHKQLLESDERYYRDKAAIQADALKAQQAALNEQEANLQGQVDNLQKQPILAKNPQDRQTQIVERNAKVAELKAKIVELDGKSAELTAKQAQNTAQLADELDALSKKRTADADVVASKLEGERGGSTQARSQQSADEYQQKRKQVVAEFTPAPDTPPEQAQAIEAQKTAALSDLDAQQGIDQANIGVQGAQQTYTAKDAGIQTQRKAVGDSLARGQISDQSAQQQRIALDGEEAQALQPLLAAYQKLAATGDLAATAKVEELQQKIAELQNPVSEVATEIRSQLNSAFESLFENMDKGKKDWQSFLKTIQKDVMGDTYKQFLQPVLQMGIAKLTGGGSPAGAAAAGAPAMSKVGGAPSLGQAVGGLFGKALGIPSPSAKGAAGSGVTVNIINQTSQPAEGSATQDGGNMEETLRAPVISILLKDLEEGGSFAQALGSGGSGMLTT